MVDSSQFRIDHAWRYFQWHAEQRMTVFNFFLVLSGLITAGLAATLGKIIDVLMTADILTEIGDRKRDRLYRYQSYVRSLD